jgi:NTE family protein
MRSMAYAHPAALPTDDVLGALGHDEPRCRRAAERMLCNTRLPGCPEEWTAFQPKIGRHAVRPGRHAGIASLLLCILLPVLRPLAAFAQAVEAGNRPRIGLVLSGGAAKGLAHIGVLRVLEEAGIPIDVITGTSMGALVGGLRATGYDPAQIERIVAGIDWDRLFSDAPERGQLFADRRFDAGRTVVTVPFSSGRPQLPAGVVGGKSIYRLIARLTWPVQAIDDFALLPVPFAAIATDLETGAAVRLDRGVLADALRATMSIPGAFGPVRLDGRLLVDGGVVRNLPAQDARDLGADVLICSDVSDPLASAENLVSAVDVLLQTVSFRMHASTEEQRQLCDVLVLPDISGLSSFSFDATSQWIERGAVATSEHLAQLRTLATDAPSPARRSSPAPTLPASVRIARIDIRGVEGESRTLAMRTLAIEPGDVTAEQLDRAIGRLYSTEIFGNAAYHVAVEGPDTVLVVNASATSGNEVGFGFRYDDRYKAALLFTGAFHNVLDFGSLAQLELRLGEQLLVEGRYSLGRGLSTPLTLSGDVLFARLPLDVYAAGSRVAEIRTSLIRTSILMGTTVGHSAIGGIQAGVEWARNATAIAATDTASRQALSTIGALYRMDTFDRTAFATRGVSILAQTEWAVPLISDGDFFRHLADVRAAIPITSTLALHLRAYAGVAHGEIPYHRLFFLGGRIEPAVFAETQPTFYGLSPQARSGRAIQMLGAGVQWELRPAFFVSLQANAGATGDRWTADLHDYSAGWAASIGTITIAGPVEFTISGRRSGNASLHLSIGHVF